MNNFVFDNCTKIIFGRDTENSVAEQVKLYGRKVLIHYGGSSALRSGLLDKVKASLDDAGISHVELGGVKPNPRLELVYKGIRLARNEQVDFILAVGGGSVIDSAKAIALGVGYKGDVWDFFEKTREADNVLPVGVILTIAAAGSESSNGAVITNEAKQLKKDYASPKLYPRFAILNPLYTSTLPAYQTACGAVDIMAHVMERYFTNTEHVQLSDQLCEGVLRTVIDMAPAALANPLDYNVRAEIMWAGTIAHNNLLGMGRQEDWGSHQIEHEISAIYDIAHGAGLAIVIPAWMRYVYKTNTMRFVQFTQRVWQIDTTLMDEEEAALEGIIRTKAFFQSLGMPVSLAEAGIRDEAMLKIMAEKCVEKGPKGNFKKLYLEDVMSILEFAG